MCRVRPIARRVSDAGTMKRTLCIRAVVAVCAVSAACTSASSGDGLAVIVTSFEYEGSPEVIGHFNLSVAESDLIVDVPAYQQAIRQLDASLMGPWQYVATTVASTNVAVTLFDLSNPVNNRLPRLIDSYVDEVHCTEALCYAVDVDKWRVVSFDPRGREQVVETTTVAQFGPGGGYSGVYEDASALDQDSMVR